MREKTPQEQYWEGQSGDAWFARNNNSAEKRQRLFKEILSKTIGVRRICELGCGDGTNLISLAALSRNFDLTGVELNITAYEKLQSIPSVTCINSSIQDLGVTERFDLVFVSGVLIHVSKDLPLVYGKMEALSNRYVLMIEYFNPEPIEVSYRGQPGLLIKRDFGKEFLKYTEPNFAIVDYGFVWKEVDSAWDNINWTLLEKRQP